MCVHLCLCVQYGYVCTSVLMCSIWLCMCVHLCLHVCVYLLSACSYLLVCKRVMLDFMSLRIHLFVCVCMCLHVQCMCMFMCVCVDTCIVMINL